MCPKCVGGSGRERSLSIYIYPNGLKAKWNCFRSTCGWSGYTEVPKRLPGIKQQAKTLQKELFEDRARLLDLSDPQLGYLELQGISEQTLKRNGVKQLRKGPNSLLAFPYKHGGEIVSCRYYNHHFEFEEEKCAFKIFYGLDDIKDASQVLIVGHELDKLALEEAGFLNCVSVPDLPHCNPQVKSLERKSKIQDKNFEYLLDCQEYLAKVDSFVLALGSDDNRKALTEELARRLGRERCWRVNWPIDEETGALCKDAIEVLRLKGSQALQDMIKNAELYPLHGLFRFCYFEKEIDDFYHERSGYEQGVSSGWKSLDPFYRVIPGEVTLVTGVPSSGKSEWIDALLCNLNRERKWSFALCSMENQVKEHGRKLLEKHIRKPFLTASYSNGMGRMSDKEYELGKLWLNKSFYLIRCENDELPSIDWVLDVAKSAVLRFGIQGLVIDPYNELDHQRPSSMNETEYVSRMLSKIKRFAQLHDCHVWFVAHPKQLQGWRGEAPSLYDISGSAHFMNKCDAGIVVHRNRDPSKGPVDQVHILVRKVRNKAAGMIGEAILDYDRATGEYRDYLA
ncbi:hypothetical protein GOP47_0001686 [Adiantum capillus-veneris]|uniref:SF4 helicase domain-containing protein n=1 Tax=Adiantum capillus-veneris TaxID=13818 RepID=A0A9D4V963_ADICA|nr:hypothetical protein GOP47_0001686 [Adiantum capillus-veneris]